MDKLKKLNNINYHDADIYSYNKDGNNISFVIKDGWEYDTYYRFELKNVNVQVMNNKPELICYVLDVFNNINVYDKINLFSGDIGILDESNGEGKYYLKLWIRHPYDMGIKTNITMNEYKFDGMNVSLSDDYDDTGRLFIKFIVDDINVVALYPLLKKYSRTSIENINNLYKYKNMFGDNEFKFFSAMFLGAYLYKNIEIKDNNISINFGNILDLFDKNTIKFLGISTNIEKEDLHEFDNNMKVRGVNFISCMRIVECSDNKYVVGFMKSNEEEIIFTCSNIVYEGKVLNFRSILD